MDDQTISRRSFLNRAAAAAAGCIAAGISPGRPVLARSGRRSAAKAEPAFRVGALDSVLSGKEGLSWEKVYSRAGELGFEGVELGVGGDYDQTELWSVEGRRRLRGYSKASGVLTPSICLHSFWTFSFADDDEAVRRRAVRMAREAALAAKEMAAGNILVPCTNPDSAGTELARERWIAGLKESVPAAEEAGVAFCLENVGLPFADKPGDILGLVDAVGSPAVKVYYDPGNAVRRGGDPLQAVRMLKGRIGQVHVKEIRGVLLGEGIVPWPEILQALRESGYSGWLMLETEATDDPRTAGRKNLETVRAMLGRSMTRSS